VTVIVASPMAFGMMQASALTSAPTDTAGFAAVFSIEMAVSVAEVSPKVADFVAPPVIAEPYSIPIPASSLIIGSPLRGSSVQSCTGTDLVEVDEDADSDPPSLNADIVQGALAPLSIGNTLPVVVPVVALVPHSALAPGLPATGPDVVSEDRSGSLAQLPVTRRSLPLPPKMAHSAGPKISAEIGDASQAAIVRTAEAEVAPEIRLVRSKYAAVPLVERFDAPIAGERPVPTVALSSHTPVDRLFAALAHREPADHQWLDTVIRDVATVATGKTGDIRFRVEPEGYGKMTIEQTADRLEISVSDPRSLVLAEAARPQVLAGAVALGVPVAGASVVLDQSGHRSREDARQRQQIEHRDAEEARESGSLASGRYA
jgi:hypothetical protein